MDMSEGGFAVTRVSTRLDTLTGLVSQTMAKKTKRKAAVTHRHNNIVPTASQLECLSAFRRLEKRLRREPTFEEVSAELGFSRTGSIGLLQALEKKGAIVRVPIEVPGPREVTDLGLQWLAMWEQQQRESA